MTTMISSGGDGTHVGSEKRRLVRASEHSEVHSSRGLDPNLRKGAHAARVFQKQANRHVRPGFMISRKRIVSMKKSLESV